MIIVFVPYNDTHIHFNFCILQFNLCIIILGITVQKGWLIQFLYKYDTALFSLIKGSAEV